MSDTYITPQELRYIADACETLTSLWELITTFGNEVSFELEDSPRLLCYDSNGDTLGFISWAEGGPAFYPSQPESAVKVEDPERGLYDRQSWALDSPCPKCGNETIIGWYYQGENGEHQHTYYNCTFWETGHVEGGSGDTGRCGWSGWTLKAGKD